MGDCMAISVVWGSQRNSGEDLIVQRPKRPGEVDDWDHKHDDGDDLTVAEFNVACALNPLETTRRLHMR